ncbi:MAG: CAP domain-containing protein [Persicimonas sp.]
MLNWPLLSTLVLMAAATVAVGCGEVDVSAPERQPSRTVEQNLGEPEDGFPSYEERAVLYLTNRARTEPDAFNEDDSYEPSSPLRYDHDLARAARWQAEHIIEQDCWCEDHSSCCEMEADDDGGGQCAGSADACGATTAEERVGYWSNDYSGENAAMGQQSAEEAIDGWINSPGHWQNINGGHGELGPGNHAAGWVQVFGRRSEPPPVAADGIHLSGQSSTTFGITYHQPDTGGPDEIMVVVDGECHDLDLAYGNPENGAFETTVSLDQGCQRYWFHVTDGEGNQHAYPTRGSLAVDNGDEDCPSYSENRPADTCSPSGEGCETGQSRPCYSGPWETRDEGICESGTQRCVGGEWEEECRNEVLPESEETCGNELDDDCDGVVDEDCEDSDESEDTGSSGDEPDSSGCRTTAGSHSAPWYVVFGLAVLWARRRRRICDDT